MATKYWLLELKGQQPLDEIHSTVGKSSANVVRVHFEGDASRVYLAADEQQRDHVIETLKGAGALKEINAETVTKLA